jgi:hypothetical protein
MMMTPLVYLMMMPSYVYDVMAYTADCSVVVNSLKIVYLFFGLKLNNAIFL